MDRHTLQKKIMRMERELLALKTAHERGLGTYRFYQYELQFTNLDYAIWEASILDGEPTSPFVQGTPFGVSAELDFTAYCMLKDERTVKVYLYIGHGDTASGKVVVVSSSDLGEFRRVQ